MPCVPVSSITAQPLPLSVFSNDTTSCSCADVLHKCWIMFFEEGLTFWRTSEGEQNYLLKLKKLFGLGFILNKEVLLLKSRATWLACHLNRQQYHMEIFDIITVSHTHEEARSQNAHSEASTVVCTHSKAASFSS